ncbi:MAG: hypothetical protein ACI4KM_09020 [Oscillospiraceae bacterium]
MNKNDFYRELMSEYSFDAEKIKQNAKKGRFARQKVSPVSIALTAAVAACTVAVGTLAVSIINSHNSGVILDTSGNTLSGLSASERLKQALEAQDKEKENTETINVLVTFTSCMTPQDAQAVIMSCVSEGNVPVKAVFLADDNRITDKAAVESLFNGFEQNIRAVAISCPASAMGVLQQRTEVALAEPISEEELATAVIVDKDAISEIIDTIEPVSPDNEPVYTDTEPVISEPGAGGDNTPEVGTDEPDDNSTAEPIEATQEASGETAEPAETEDAPVVTEPETNEPTVDIPEVITPAEDSLPAGVTLPVQADKLNFESEYIGAENAYFISENKLFVKTSDTIALYSFNGVRLTLAAEAPAVDAKVGWIAENGGRMIVSSLCDDGRRTKLWYVDADNSLISDMSAEDMVMDGTIAGFGYNSGSRLLAINIKENGMYYVCAAKLTSEGSLDYIGTPFESKSKVTLMCSGGNTLYLAVTSGSLTQVMAVDAVTENTDIIKSYDNNPKISKNLAFTQSVIAPSDTAVIGFTEILEGATGKFAVTDFFDTAITFGASRVGFMADGQCYTVADGRISPAGGVAALAPIEYKKSLSAQYAVSAVTEGKVKITDSIYTAQNKSGLLTFTAITENCSEQLKSAMTRAIGVNNALAQYKCETVGLDTPEKLSQAIRAAYSESAAAKLCAKCNISSTVLNYTRGGLKPISADSAALVINSRSDTSASGTLYIAVGSFGGKTAYSSVNVSFVYENGWKLDMVL